jgi:hypothetical protein
LIQVRSCQRGDDAEDETADETVAQGGLVLFGGQAEHHDGHDERVVGAQQSLEDHEQPRS